jgi:E3 ubiquitin-protein ligase BRE1
MESKKRPHAPENDVSVAKKRILSGANGAPYVNGSVPEIEEPSDLDNLEVFFAFSFPGATNFVLIASQMFRKEAIFRRMKHYSREHERSQSRIAELERRKNTCEAGLAAMAACWTQVSLFYLLLMVADYAKQLVETIRSLAKPEALLPLPPNTRGPPPFFIYPHIFSYGVLDIFDISSCISDDDAPDLVSALEDNMQVTQNLVTKFVNLGGDSQLSGGDAYSQYQRVQTEVRPKYLYCFTT